MPSMKINTSWIKDNSKKAYYMYIHIQSPGDILDQMQKL